MPSYWHSGHRHCCLPVCLPRRAAWISLSPPLEELVFETVCSAWQVWFAFQAHRSQVRPGDPLHGADTLSLSPHMPIHITQKSWGSQALLGTGLVLSGKEEGAIVDWSLLWISRSTKEGYAVGECPSPCRCCLTRCACTQTCPCAWSCHLPVVQQQLGVAEGQVGELAVAVCVFLLSGQWQLGMSLTRQGLGRAAGCS